MSAPILVIAGSVRGRRRSPAIAEWVARLGREETGAAFETVDLRELGLTMDDEPGLPAAGDYLREPTRRWSERVKAATAVVFVTPQYNWGYPAPLKNAVDHIYAEWRGKPAALVTFGSRGGNLCAEQFGQVMKAVKLRPVATQPQLKLPPGRIEADDAQVDLPADFADKADEVRRAMRELVELASAPA